jgi:hypothetical protein
MSRSASTSAAAATSVVVTSSPFRVCVRHALHSKYGNPYEAPEPGVKSAQLHNRVRLNTVLAGECGHERQ